MFFTGSLQEGIATALQQSKCVFCFVTDEQDESQLWETQYLTESSIASLLQSDAVALRLKQGSEEAGFLSAIFPLPNTPTVVVIKNGDLKEYIVAGTSKDEFVRRVTAAFRGAQGQSAAAQSPQPVQPAASSSIAPAPAPAAQETDDLYDEPTLNPPQTTAAQPQQATRTSTANSSPRGPATPTQEEENAAALRAVLAERAARLEAQRIESERKAKEARRAKAEADTSKQAAETRSHREALQKARQEAAEEKARILKKIEDDRAERRAKASQRAATASRNQEPKLGDVAAALTRSESSPLAPSASGASGMTALQVRLLDGSTIRSRFPSSKTLRGDVRPWVDGQQQQQQTNGAKEPYRFKVVLAPQPSKRIDDTEEDKSLAELGLAPSATLVLAPVGAHAIAYEGGSVGGMVASFLMLPLALLQWLWGLMFGVFSGLGARAQQGDEGGAEPVTVREQRKERFSQFANPDDRRGDHQLYNGNSLNFEPRPDEKKDE